MILVVVVVDDVVAFVCTQETSVYSLSGRTSWSVHRIGDAEKSEGGLKAKHLTVTHLFDDHARSSCLTLAFESECTCSAPLTLPNRPTVEDPNPRNGWLVKLI